MDPNKKVKRKAIPFIANSSRAGFIAILSHCVNIGPVNLMLLELLIICMEMEQSHEQRVFP